MRQVMHNERECSHHYEGTGSEALDKLAAENAAKRAEGDARIAEAEKAKAEEETFRRELAAKKKADEAKKAQEDLKLFEDFKRMRAAQADRQAS